MSTVIVSKVPQTISNEKLYEFFSFCGKVKSINLIEETDKFGKYEVQFELEKALNTALLLNEAELDSVPILVEKSDTPPDYAAVGSQNASYGGDNKIQSSDLASGDKKDTDASTITGDSEYDDISQEEKPKYAIMAQLLASGYTLSDNLIQKGIDVDKEKGYSTKFKSFLTSLDENYIHSSKPDSAAGKGISKAQSTLGDLAKSFNDSGYHKKWNQYLEKASSHPYGVKVHDFYKNLAKDAKEVHLEAKRLSELKKEREAEKNVESAASTANAGAAINTVNE